MATSLPGLNPEILKWARIRAGLSLGDVAAKLKKESSIIESWESGESAPTYLQLDELAYTIYKRPIALFFFPKPPDEPKPEQSFRTLPAFELNNLESDTLYAIRQSQAMQLTLRELNEGINPLAHNLFVEVSIGIDSNTILSAATLRSYLGISLSEQIEWIDTKTAFKRWRDAIQEKGIYVFKRPFKQKDISGFCIFDQDFPVIYISNSTSISRQIFSLFHELSHILLKTNSLSKIDDSYINDLSDKEKRIEFFCNRFAADFLVPTEDFEKLSSQGPPFDNFIQESSRRYKVSREVILRKLLDKKKIDQKYYKLKVEQWTKEYEQEEKGKWGGGGNYYANVANYLGNKFINLAFNKYYNGRCSIEQLAVYLNIKVTNVPKFEHFVLDKAMI